MFLSAKHVMACLTQRTNANSDESSLRDISAGVLGELDSSKLLECAIKISSAQIYTYKLLLFLSFQRRKISYQESGGTWIG